MSAEELHSILRDSASRSFANEASFIADVVPRFVKSLGYDESHLLFQYFLGHASRYYADAVVLQPTTMKPWLLIEAKGPRFPISRLHYEAADQLRRYLSVVTPEHALLLMPTQLWLYQGNSFARFALDAITLQQASEIFEELKCPEVWPPPGVARPNPPTPQKALSFEYFSIDTTTLAKKVVAAEAAMTNKEKGETYEEMAATVFSSVRGVKVKHRNLLGSSHEIDLILEHQRDTSAPLFREFGRYSLVECKNWSEPMNSKHVRDFKGKLIRTKVQLGFIMSRNGVTGAHNGADALREIRAAADAEDVYLIVVSLADIKAIEAGADFYSFLDDRLDRLRFDF